MLKKMEAAFIFFPGFDEIDTKGHGARSEIKSIAEPQLLVSIIEEINQMMTFANLGNPFNLTDQINRHADSL